MIYFIYTFHHSTINKFFFNLSIRATIHVHGHYIAKRDIYTTIHKFLDTLKNKIKYAKAQMIENQIKNNKSYMSQELDFNA